MNAGTGLDRALAMKIFLLALVVRLLNIAHIHWSGESFLVEDSPIYTSMVSDYLKTGGFNYIVTKDGADLAVPIYERTPGYTYFMLVVRAVVGASSEMLVVVQAVLDSASCVLLTYTARFLDRQIAVLSGVLAALWPNMIIHSAMVLTDTLFLFLVVLCCYALVRFLETSRMRVLVLAGLACGAAVIVRPVAQFAPFCLAIFLVAVFAAKRVNVKRGAACIAVFLIATSVLVAPWIYRNQVVFGETRLAAQTGNHLANWVVPLVVSNDGGETLKEVSDRYDAEFQRRMTREGFDYKTMNPVRRDSLLVRYGLEALADLGARRVTTAWFKGMVFNLGAPAVLLDNRVRALKADSFLGGVGSIGERILARLTAGNAYSLVLIVSGIVGALCSVLQAAGAVWLLRHDRSDRIVLLVCLSIVLYFLVLTGPVLSPKYRLPAEPALIVLTAVGIVRVMLPLTRQRHGSSSG